MATPGTPPLADKLASLAIDSPAPKEKAPKAPKAPKEAKPSSQAPAGGKEVKKETQLGMGVTREDDFGAWYSQVVTQGEMIEYYDVSGCYILRPWSYAIWERIKDHFDAEIKKLGVENAYFPLFVSEKALTAEKDHVEGFAPEVAWVTRSGDTELEAPIAVRPTSETVMYPIFATWVRSHRDLPLKLNQWCNVVRWEFKHPTPFIRSREFLWQEGHTVYATKAEADREVRQVLDRYKEVYEQLLAVPVIQGVKSEKEKFAGGLYTTTVEAFIPATGRGIQAATSHCLGQNFAKMFGIEFENADGGRSMAWQNSWGLTTRSIGVAVMVHGDNTGLVLPPRVAPMQVVIVPIPNAKLSEAEKAALLGGAEAAAEALRARGVRVKLDARENYTPGWKYNHWELKGVPLRCEFGPRDLAAGTCVLVRRDSKEKETVALAGLPARCAELLEAMQASLLAKAVAERNSRITKVTAWADFVPALDRKHMVLAPWCEAPESEEWVKKQSSKESEKGAAKTLCIPFEQPPLPPNTPCFTGFEGRTATCWALWGRSY